MTSLALINQFLGQQPNASEHGYQIDHIIEFSHWFMGALFLGWSAFFIFVLVRFRKSRNPVANHEGVTSGISTHLEFAVVLIEAVLLVGFAIPLWAKRVNAFPEISSALFFNLLENSAGIIMAINASFLCIRSLICCSVSSAHVRRSRAWEPMMR